MQQDLQPHPLAKPIRRLTIAAWVIAAVLLLNTLAPYAVMLFPQLYVSQAKEIEESLNKTLGKEEFSVDAKALSEKQKFNTIPGNQFHAMPLDEKIIHASAIALTRIEKTSDGKQRQVIQEFLKKAPGVTIYNEVGSEFQSRYVGNDEMDYGDGAIVFFLGSPARAISWSYFSGDRVDSLERIPLSLLREKCKAAQGAPNSAVQ
ncbi:hypothetical protein [Aquipseudomonas ullengensis]|uniref:Uncharacterized protein n=1 Tax=Aquipseudomonas ullengensis TaxID=2759166 RepID=A0A7W4Q9P0_9GAMM|nr:hypothetical protein [Pseudomonas ullengensis]MBB2494849.1 hypothetical protein [Pseudomonas ullengensis]